MTIPPDAFGLPELPDGSTFGADWLSLREPVDHRSRAEELIGPLAGAWIAGGWRHAVDLGSGTGSNVRYLAPRLPVPQSWILVDHDPTFLDRVVLPPEADDAVYLTGDLAREGLAAIESADLVTASALLDLVSEAWLDRVVQASVAGRRGVLFTTSYDGVVSWRSVDGGGPDAADGGVHPDDGWIRDLVNRHQMRDKGLGPALGPRAAGWARSRFEAHGYRTWLVPSPWRLGSEDTRLAELLVEGWVEAGCAEDPDGASRVRAWGVDRMARIRSGAFHLTVGHLDLLALPPEDPAPR